MLITWLQQYCKLKPPQPLFADTKATASLQMHFCVCQINTTKVVQGCPIKMEQL